MFLTHLFEALDRKHASFCFGRMNPPTVGHKQLIDTVAKSAQGGDYFIFASQTQDKKKNPLSWQQKVSYLTELFPEHAAHIVKDPEVKTIMDAIHWLYNNGYREVTMVAGSDRLASFQELIPKYNGVEGTNGAYYKFDKINFASSGERDPDADGVAGVSASGAREAAKAGDFATFQQNIGTNNTKLAQKLYRDVRAGMHIVDEATIGSRLDFDKQLQMHKYQSDLAKQKTAQQPQATEPVKKTPQVPHTVTMADRQAKVARLSQLVPIKKEIEKLKARAERKAGYLPRGLAADLEDYYTLDDVDTHFDEMLAAYQKQLNALEQYLQMRKTVWTPKRAVQEEAAGVGVVATNKKMAKDPRYSTSMTVDVHPDTPRKNAKALKLV